MLFLVKIHGAGGTYFFAGTALALLDVNAGVSIDTVFQGNGLSVLDKGRFAFDQTGVVGINDFFGTLFCAGTTGDAQRLINISRMARQFDPEVACAPFNFFDFTERFELDI